MEGSKNKTEATNNRDISKFQSLPKYPTAITTEQSTKPIHSQQDTSKKRKRQTQPGCYSKAKQVKPAGKTGSAEMIEMPKVLRRSAVANLMQVNKIVKKTVSRR
eukprot:TRINITY_DN18884_c0_g2_i1.p2 TRINITY_DN18884_c0_g2~~TRINITY_DN18884_c0_g2_i1.p2  ORF type:complete len:104 (+),score=31.81 TRINITY_DN18884_c0_g2_i1:157-468(+)